MQISSLNAARLNSALRSIRPLVRALPPLSLSLSLSLFLSLCALLTHGSATLAQAYPSKPVRFLSGQPPGGATDFFARMVAQKLNDIWKQPVLIEHRPGASGSIAVELTVKAPPDGHTLVFVTAGQIVINPHLLKLNFDPLVDLAPVAFLVHTSMLLVTHPSVPAKSASELIALAKARPGKLNVGSGGNGVPTHLAAELFMSLTGTRMAHIPFKGSAPSVIALVGGQVDLSFSTVAITLPQMKAGRIRALAVTSPRRNPAVPHLPTMAEAGMPGFESQQWFALFGPAALPKDIIARLHTEVAHWLETPALRTRLSTEGAEPGNLTLDQFATFIRADAARWMTVIKASGATAE